MRGLILLPLECRELLAQMKGRRLERAERVLLPSDYDYWPAEERDQLSDGSLDLFFDDGLRISFWSFTEPWSVGILPDPRPIPDWVHRDVSANSFWQGITGEVVAGVTVLTAPVLAVDGVTAVYPGEFGVLVDMANGRRFLVEYAADAELPDTLRIMPGLEHLPPGTFQLVSI